MLDSVKSVTNTERQGGLGVALIIGSALGLAGGFGAQYKDLFDTKGHREPPYVHPEVTLEDWLTEAYRAQPFYDIRREGTDRMFALIGEQPSALLKALEIYRNEGHSIAPTGLLDASIVEVEALIQWCVEHQLQEAADNARAMMESYRATMVDHPLPSGELHAF